MEKTFGNLEFAGEDKTEQRRINGRMTVLSRSFNLYSDVQRADDIVVILPAEAGEKHFPKEFLEQGYAVIAVNYRLSPRAQNPAYTEDAAEAVAWTFENIEEFGGDKDKIYIAGHSAGGYLCLMLNLDKSYLAKWNIDANSLAGAFPISGQTTTHYTIRKERGLPSDTPIIDKYAPSNNVRKDASPMILITGDKELEMLARYEENAHLYALLKALGQKTTLYQMEGFDHGTVAAPACTLINSYMKKAGKK